jgi:cell division protein ZapA
LSQPVQVTIYGQHYTVRSEDNPERVKRLAERVDELMREIANRGVIDSNRAAVLACLHMADELDRMSTELNVIKQVPEARQKLSDLLQLLDDELK